MKKALFVAVASLFMFSCSNKDDNNIDKSSFSNTTWELVGTEGYEIEDGERDEWKETPTDYFQYYTFKEDGTGLEKYIEKYDGEEYTGTSDIKWSYNEKNNTLTIIYVEYPDEAEVYEVEGMSSTEMILIDRFKEDGYEYYEKMTYRKR